MGFHPRKLLKLEKPNSDDKDQAVKVKKNASCDVLCSPKCPDECSDNSHINYLSPPPPPLLSPSTDHSSTILIIILCILGVALFLVSYFSITRYRSSLRNHRRRASLPVNDDGREDFADENRGPVLDHPIWYIRTVGLQQSVIDSIEVFKYRKDEGLIEGTDCSVCLSEFQDDENLRLLPKCSHAFHIHCIDTWLRSHKNCPLCRARIVNDADVARVSEGEPNLDNPSSGEENQVEMEDAHAVLQGNGVGENGAAEMRVRSEGTVSLPIEEENEFKDFPEENSRYGPASRYKVRVKSDLVDHRMEVVEEMEPVIRSISLGSSSASVIYHAVANTSSVEEDGMSSNTEDEGCSNVNAVEKMKQNSEMVFKSGNRTSSIYSLVKTSSLGRTLQKVPISMKRSFSSTGKSSLPTHSRRQDFN